MKNTEKHPALYCGTYGKYNRGSIGGKWVDLTQFENGQQFFDYCRKIHSDEADPEFMFQDCENLPSWFYRESMGLEQVDEILAWWKAEQAKPKEQPDALTLEYVNEMGRGDDSGIAKIIRLGNGGLYPIYKESIETRFCFHDEGPDYEFYCELRDDESRLKAYFMSQNLKKIDRYIEELEADEDNTPQELRLKREYEGKNIWYCCDIYREYSWYELDKAREKTEPLTDDDKMLIKNALFEVRQKRVKRLETWWKRYGKDKLYMWTYWADA